MRNTTTIKNKEGTGITFVLLSAGPGNRTKIYGPPCILDIVKQHKLIDLQIYLIRKMYGNAEIIVVVGFQNEKIKKYIKNKYNNIKIITNDVYSDTGAVYSASLAMDIIHNRMVYFIYGDLFFTQNALHNNVSRNFVVSNTSNGTKKKEIGITSKNDIVTNMSYGLKNKWGQIAFFQHSTLDTFDEIVTQNPTSRYWPMPHIINELINMGHKFYVETPHNTYIKDIDSMTDLKEIKEYANSARHNK
jgi:choline kinase